jgi:ABC-type sugar transport system substrate-binding protein
MLLVTGICGVFAGGASADTAKKPNVIFVNVGSNLPYPAATQRAFEEMCAQKGWDHSVLDGQFDSTLNVKNIEQATAMKPDVMIIMVQDAKMQSNAIRAACRAGVPIVLDTGRPEPGDRDFVNTYCGVDDIMAGRIGAELVYDALGGKGNIVVIHGVPGQQTTEDRFKGFDERMKELNSQIKVLGNDVGAWSKEKSTAIMADFLTKFKGQIDGVFAQDDESGAGAAIAIQEAGIPKGQIKIIGTGGSKTGLQMVKDGWFYGTSYQSPKTTMALSINAAEYIITNKIKAGQKLDPFWRWIELPKVTAANVEQFLPGEW